MDRSPTSDSDGRFRIETQAPAVVLRKEGYVSLIVRTHEAVDVRLVMNNASARKQMPVCSKEGDYVSLGQGTFALPKVKDVRIGRIGGSIDAIERTFILSTRTGTSKMVHGTGLSWGGATPRTLDIWVTDVFGEEALDAHGSSALDSHGKTADGRFWRHIGRSGESVFYYDVDQHDAMVFDAVLNGLCVKEFR